MFCLIQVFRERAQVVPLEEIFDNGGDDLDSEAEILMWIKDFLQNELGKLGGNVPMLLMNNIRSLNSDEMVLQVKWILIFYCVESFDSRFS